MVRRVDLLIQSGRTIDAIRMDGWRIHVGYPEDREEAERRLQETGGSVDEATVNAAE
jgi:glucose-1-phosphate thymidylyltransferase